MMTFANPLLLAGTALVALPIVLHLIMRRKPRLLEFPALRFVQQRHESNRRRLRLRHLLLLALRIAVIGLLAMALARPSVKLSGVLGSQEAPVAAALVFDTSPRMEYRQGNRTRVEAARELGLWLLGQLPEESQIAVLDSRPGPAAFQVDRGTAEQRINRLGTVAGWQAMTDALEEALRLLGDSELIHKEVYVFTDLARAAWPGSWAARLASRAAEVPGVGIYVIDVGTPEPKNFALGDVGLSADVLARRSPLKIRSQLSVTGPGGERTVELYMLDAQRKEQKRSQETCTLKPDESQQVEFSIGGLDLGTHQGVLRIVGEDNLGCDDARFFTVEVQRPWRILVAAPKPARRYGLFLTEALAPANFRRTGQARFDCDVITLDELPKRGLEPYSAVCLLDPTPLKPDVWGKLADFASEGHGVAVFLGHNARLEPFNQPDAQELLPGKLLRQARRPDGDLYLAPRDFQHPILKPLASLAGAIPWNGLPVYRYWQLDEPAGGVHVVLPFTAGRPALLERPLGKGRVLTMTTPVSDRPGQKAWNLLLPAGEESWPFVILANTMMSYLVGSSDQRLNYFAGQTVVLQLDSNEQRRNYLLSAPGDLEFPLSADLKQHVLVVTSAETAGNYRVRAGGTVSGVDRGFSVNLPEEQTRLDRLTDEELAEVFGPLQYRVARDRNELEMDFTEGRVGRDLFPLLIVLIALLLGLEHLVANRFYRQ